jgi:GWxTD domain-containing protein
MTHVYLRLLPLLLITGLLMLMSCSSSRNVNIERGSGYNFQEGHPEFRINAFGYIDEEEGPLLRITTELVKGSLIYKKQNDSLQANYSFDLQVLDLENSENIITNRSMQDRITSADENIGNSRETHLLEYNMEVDPSRYRVVVNIRDLNSDKELIQETEAYIPDTETGAYSLSGIQMYGKSNGDEEWNPINTYDVKSKIDSLRFIFQVISEREETPMVVESELIRFKSDTSHPRPMHFSNYSPSSIEYKGIDYDDKTVIESSQRVLTNYSSTFMEYQFPIQKRGNYHFEVRAKKENRDGEVYKARAFGIKSENYPAISSAREMAQPLVYLMGEGDHRELMKISEPDSLKKEVDRFWLQHIGSSSRARDVIQMYYERVEAANKQFSNFKEGWKTDLGMIYILFGSPWYTENHLKEIIWYYSYNHQDPEYSYRFYQPKLKNEYYPFYHFLLQRNNYYYTVQYLQRQLWLSGQILRRQI